MVDAQLWLMPSVSSPWYTFACSWVANRGFCRVLCCFCSDLNAMLKCFLVSKKLHCMQVGVINPKLAKNALFHQALDEKTSKKHPKKNHPQHPSSSPPPHGHSHQTHLPTDPNQFTKHPPTHPPTQKQKPKPPQKIPTPTPKPTNHPRG